MKASEVAPVGAEKVAWRVYRLLTGPVGRRVVDGLIISETGAVYNAGAGRITYLDVDGERRTAQVPAGMSPVAVAAVFDALAAVWTQRV